EPRLQTRHLRGDLGAGRRALPLLATASLDARLELAARLLGARPAALPLHLLARQREQPVAQRLQRRGRLLAARLGGMHDGVEIAELRPRALDLFHEQAQLVLSLRARAL